MTLRDRINGILLLKKKLKRRKKSFYVGNGNYIFNVEALRGHEPAMQFCPCSTCGSIGDTENWFHITQLLTGHGCFSTYLHRIGKAESTLCPFCMDGEDSPEHTLQKCEEWREQRELLTSVIGEDLSLSKMIQQIGI